MSRQVLSKEVGRACSVREPIDSKVSVMAIIWGLLLPLLLILSAALSNLVIRAVRSVNSISPAVRKAGDQPSIPMLVLLTLLLLLTYPLSMLLVELLPPLHQTSFLLVMLKYVVGTSHHLLVPIGILVVRADLRGIVVDIYRKGGTNQGKTFEMTMEEMQRELGLGVDCG